jgi:hypothetical protein
MAVITWTTAFAALPRSPIGFLAQATLATGAVIAAVSLIDGAAGWQHTAGWVFVAAATLGFGAGAALMLTSGGGEPVAYEHGDPGVKVGQ